MNADVAVFTPGPPWSKSSARANVPDSDPPAWVFPSLRPSCEPMYPGDPSPGPRQHLDFFHKLGYSTAQVHAVQQKFGPNMDTDKLLGELVRIRSSQGAEDRGPVTTVSVLVPRGDPQAAAGPTMLLPVTRTAASPHSREDSGEDEDALRPVVIDGSNVAMSHGNKEVFSCLGIQLAVNFFADRGHSEITVFVPSWRKEQPRPDVPITDQHILRDLERRRILVFTPSKRVAGKRVVCNDDRFIVKLGYECDGVVVSNDMYRDLQAEKPEWKRFIDERLLMYSFVNNKFMPPDDPQGRYGPTLENFLRRFPKTQKKQLCPYGKKCTYGIKCKFHHPERAKQSNRLVADELRENAKHPPAAPKPPAAPCSPVPGQSLSLVEDMAKKLTLDSLKKDHKNENARSKRAASRQDMSVQHSDHVSRQSGSQEQLDSGLGSIESQPAYGSSARPQYCAPCSCCSHGSSCRGPSFQHYSIPYPPQYAGYGAYAVSVPAAYRQPPDFQPPDFQPPDFQHNRAHGRQHFWSDPYGQWDRSPCAEERDVVRKKLLAIFSARLVDAAMDRFPQLMDPQMLVAEILKLQSQNRSPR